MPIVFFEREGKTLRTNAGWNLRKLAKANGIHIYKGIYRIFNCRGQGLCGTCKVEVFAGRDGDLNPRTAMEENRLNGFSNPNLRLSCQVVVQGNLRVKTQPVELMASDQELAAPPLIASD